MQTRKDGHKEAIYITLQKVQETKHEAQKGKLNPPTENSNQESGDVMKARHSWKEMDDEKTKSKAQRTMNPNNTGSEIW